MDVTCDKAIKKAVDEVWDPLTANKITSPLFQVSKIVGDCGLNILVNNAGILNEYQTDGEPDRKAITEHLIINAISPVIVIQVPFLSYIPLNYFLQYFLPLLKRAAESSAVCRVINISSNLASITRDIAEGGSTEKGYLAYSMSKVFSPFKGGLQ